MINREKDIQKVVSHVINSAPVFWDNPNGAYELSCPYCDAEEYRGQDYFDNPTTMESLDHNLDCIYLIAKDLVIKESK